MKRRDFLKFLGPALIAAVGGMAAAKGGGDVRLGRQGRFGGLLHSYEAGDVRVDFDPPVQIVAGQKVSYSRRDGHREQQNRTCGTCHAAWPCWHAPRKERMDDLAADMLRYARMGELD